jgi:hypothetical protein
MSSAAESFFDITTGRNHGIVPTADALRVVLDSGATLLLWRDGESVKVRASAVAGRESVEASGERIDQALSALVGKLVLGKSGVEVTEWEVAAEHVQSGGEHDGRQLGVQFGRITVPLFAPDESDRDGDIARKIVGAVELMRRGCGCGGRVHAIVVRVGRDGPVGIACMPCSPEPPIGATLVARRFVGETVPHVDVRWDSLDHGRKTTLLQRAIETLKRDRALAGLADGHTKLCLLSTDGRQLAIAELNEYDDAFAASRARAEMERTAGRAGEPVLTLRMTAVCRTAAL